MTVANSCPANSATDFERCAEISIPASRIASIASGFTPTGFVPALKTS